MPNSKAPSPRKRKRCLWWNRSGLRGEELRDNHKVEKPIFVRWCGPKALEDKGHKEKQKSESRNPGYSRNLMEWWTEWTAVLPDLAYTVINSFSLVLPIS